MKPSSVFKNIFLSFIKARHARLKAKLLYENAMRQIPDEVAVVIYKYVLCFHDELVALSDLLEPAMEYAKDDEVIKVVREYIGKVDEIAPHFKADQRKALFALVKKADQCSGIERMAATLHIEGNTLSEIALKLPRSKKTGRPMTRQGIKQVLRRFEKKTGRTGLFSMGTYRNNERVKADVGMSGKMVYWSCREDRNKSDEESQEN